MISDQRAIEVLSTLNPNASGRAEHGRGLLFNASYLNLVDEVIRWAKQPAGMRRRRPKPFVINGGALPNCYTSDLILCYLNGWEYPAEYSPYA